MVHELESGGYLYCHDCGNWYDDTYCYPEDHSRHCGHTLKPAGDDEWPPPHAMVTTCQSLIVDMLAACEELLQVADSAPFRGHMVEPRAKARAAIAKATGRG